MGAIFGKKGPPPKTLQQIIKEQKRINNRSIRNLERECKKMDREMMKNKKEMKKLAKENQQKAVRVLAKDYVTFVPERALFLFHILQYRMNI